MGIDYNQKDMVHRTAIDLAKKNEFYEIAKIIEYYQISNQKKKKKENCAEDVEIEKINLNLNF